MDDIIYGCVKTYEYIEKLKCENCDGIGIDNPAINTIKCIACNGKGVNKDMPFLSCIECNGRGIFITNNKICKQCLGAKIFLMKRRNTIQIKPKIMDNTMIKITPSLEIVIKYNLNTYDSSYTMNYHQNKIVVKVFISLIELVCGFQKQIKINNKKTYIIESKEVFDINETFIKSYDDNVKIVFKIYLRVDSNDTKNMSKKLFRSFRNILGLKPFEHFPPDLEIVNIQNQQKYTK